MLIGYFKSAVQLFSLGTKGPKLSVCVSTYYRKIIKDDVIHCSWRHILFSAMSFQQRFNLCRCLHLWQGKPHYFLYFISDKKDIGSWNNVESEYKIYSLGAESPQVLVTRRLLSESFTYRVNAFPSSDEIVVSSGTSNVQEYGSLVVKAFARARGRFHTWVQHIPFPMSW